MKKASRSSIHWVLSIGCVGFLGIGHSQAQTTPPANPQTPAGKDAKEDVFKFDLDAIDLDKYFNTDTLDALTLESLNKAIAAKPNDTEAYEKRGKYYFDKKQYPQALADYKKACELSPNLPVMHEHLAEVYRAQKDVNNALAEYGKAIELEAPNTFRLGERAKYFDELGRNEEALADYNKRVELEPDGWAGHYWRGRFLTNQGQYDKALLDYEKLIQIDPKDIDYRLRHANTLRMLKRYDDAIASYTVAVQLAPTRMDAFSGLGATYWKTESYDMAEETYKQALTLNDDDTLGYIYLNRGRMRLEEGKRSAALGDFDMAIKTEGDLQKQGKSCLDDSSLALAYLYRSYIKARGLYIASKDADKAAAAADATKAVQLDPSLVRDYLQDNIEELGNGDVRFGRTALLTGVAAARPDDIAVLIKLGNAQQASFNSKDAIVTYTKLLALDPKSSEAFKGRATSYADSSAPYDENPWVLAVADWKSYLALRPDDTKAQQELGVALYNTGQTAEGIKVFRQLTAEQPKSCYAHLLLGLGLAISGDEKGANAAMVAALLGATPDEFKAARSHFGNAKTHYPTNEIIKSLTDTIDANAPDDEDDEKNDVPFFV